MASDKLEATLLKPKAMVVLTAVIQAAEGEATIAELTEPKAVAVLL